MNVYQEALIEEHSNLIVRTQNLYNYIYSEASTNDDRVEFANKCIQLSHMKKYEETLRTRIENTGIVFEDGQYFEKVAEVNPLINMDVLSSTSNDFDADKENQTPQEAKYGK